MNWVSNSLFIPSAYKFPDPSNPWKEEYPQFININDLKDKTSSDFVGIKMGDVNGSATKSTATASSLRSSQALHIKAELLNKAQQNFNAGETLTLALSSTELASVQGYQFTLNFDPKLLALENLEYHSIKAENLGVFAREGDITLSWAGNGKQLAAEETLMVLHFKAKAGGNLPEAFQLNGRRTPAEAYTHSDEVIGVQLDWGKAQLSPAGATLQQNTPNPFKEETTIEFSLPKATHATLSIRDVAGRLLWSNSSLFAKGSNRININAEAFKGNGVLYYTLEADGFTATRKMIVLD